MCLLFHPFPPLLLCLLLYLDFVFPGVWMVSCGSSPNISICRRIFLHKRAVGGRGCGSQKIVWAIHTKHLPKPDECTASKLFQNCVRISWLHKNVNSQVLIYSRYIGTLFDYLEHIPWRNIAHNFLNVQFENIWLFLFWKCCFDLRICFCFKYNSRFSLMIHFPFFIICLVIHYLASSTI